MEIKVTKKYVYVYLGELLVHRFFNAYDTDYDKGFERQYKYSNPELKDNRLWITKERTKYCLREGKTVKFAVSRRVSFPLKREVLEVLAVR